MLDGRVSPVFSAQIGGHFTNGRIVPGKTDRTWDLSAGLRIPLFSPRVNLSLWMPVREWYTMSPEVMAARRISPGINGRGSEYGPAFISVDIHVLKAQEGHWWPDLALRIALRTASEDKAFASARSYDCPGYFFDIAAGRSFGPFRLALSTGFLCWQTDNGRQNDAVMFGVLARYNHQYFNVSAQYGGYFGWERYGDFPRSLKARAEIGPGHWPVRPVLTFQHGFNDWPFDSYGVGITYSINKAKHN
ncbi:MAG: hypothetical protein MJY61_00180 [Bacteroidales bacterium]|nr:hypothetical protein [Bacteroidales bacterium]